MHGKPCFALPCPQVQIALCQLAVTADKDANLKTAKKAILVGIQ